MSFFWSRIEAFPIPIVCHPEWNMADFCATRSRRICGCFSIGLVLGAPLLVLSFLVLAGPLHRARPALRRRQGLRIRPRIRRHRSALAHRSRAT